MDWWITPVRFINNEGMDELRIKFVDKWLVYGWVYKHIKKWIIEWMNGWINKLLSEWINSSWISEWLNNFMKISAEWIAISFYAQPTEIRSLSHTNMNFSWKTTKEKFFSPFHRKLEQKLKKYINKKVIKSLYIYIP